MIDCRGGIPVTARELAWMSAIVYDFKVLSAKLRKPRVDDRQRGRHEPDSPFATPSLVSNDVWSRYLSELLNRVEPK